MGLQSRKSYPHFTLGYFKISSVMTKTNGGKYFTSKRHEALKDESKQVPLAPKIAPIVSDPPKARWATCSVVNGEGVLVCSD